VGVCDGGEVSGRAPYPIVVHEGAGDLLRAEGPKGQVCRLAKGGPAIALNLISLERIAPRENSGKGHEALVLAERGGWSGA